MNNFDLAFKPEKYQAFIVIDISKKDLIESYTLRARIGIKIAEFLGIVKVHHKGDES
jgi:hypothetical protein